MGKKAAAKATKASAGVGLTGAGERVRGWVKTEMDVVVSAKEAELARQQLIKERKTLAEEIQKLKVECRRTMTHQEMKETSTKQTDLQEQLDMRNLQISELQKEIMLAEQDKEKSIDRWAKMTSMTDSKIAVSFLFNSATEAMATATTRAREVRELKSQIDELMANLGAQKEKLSQQRMEHETEVCRMTRESENNVLILLNQMYNSDSTVAEGSNSMSVTKELIEKMLGKEATALETLLSKNERMIWLEEEVERLKSEIISLRSAGGDSQVFKAAAPAAPVSTKKAARRITILKPVVEKYTEEEEDEDGESGKPVKKKSSQTGCKCKSGCKTKACSCRKAGPYCTSLCRCPPNKCSNREEPGSDVSVNSTMDTDKENELNEDEDGSPDTTDKLLNGTFDLPGKLKFTSNPGTPNNRTPLGSLASGSIFKTPNSGADLFAEESDIEATPRAKSPVPRIQVHVPEVGSTRKSKSPMRRAALEEDSSPLFPSPVFDRLTVSNKHSNGH